MLRDLLIVVVMRLQTWWWNHRWEVATLNAKWGFAQAGGGGMSDDDWGRFVNSLTFREFFCLMCLDGGDDSDPGGDVAIDEVMPPITCVSISSPAYLAHWELEGPDSEETPPLLRFVAEGANGPL